MTGSLLIQSQYHLSVYIPMWLKEPVCFVIDIVTVFTYLAKNIYGYNYAKKTFSNIKEYVKCLLQIFMHIIFNQ
jgi:hypothetical protein